MLFGSRVILALRLRYVRHVLRLLALCSGAYSFKSAFEVLPVGRHLAGRVSCSAVFNELVLLRVR